MLFLTVAQRAHTPAWGQAALSQTALKLNPPPSGARRQELHRWNARKVMTAASPLEFQASGSARGVLDVGRIDTWVFDLDNTLYPPRANLFGQIDQRMTAFIMELLSLNAVEARALQKHYFLEYGTTLHGLMHYHGVDPRRFLDYVHDIDLTVVGPDAALRRALAALPGRKLVFTNGDAVYARRVLERLGIADHIEAIHDIVATDFVPKPHEAPYDQLLSEHGIDARRAVFVEDMARNLLPAKARGMGTVWVNNGSEKGGLGASPDYIDLEITDVAAWLGGIALTPAPAS